jgi:hypothetical protein
MAVARPMPWLAPVTIATELIAGETFCLGQKVVHEDNFIMAFEKFEENAVFLMPSSPSSLLEGL